jgi:2-aminophenol/2-amino-5-chlorophenol 1,6-dioxygenase alpha subunit
MSIEAAFLLPASPLPYFKSHNPPWAVLSQALQEAGRRVHEIDPDVLIVYPTTWYAVMDQLWQTRPHLEGLHTDHSWFEYGDLPFSFETDTDLANACVASANEKGIQSKGVNYDGFPIDTGTIVAMHYLNPEGKIPVLITSNNLYHDSKLTREIAGIAISELEKQGKRAVVIGIGELSASFFREEIDIAADTFASEAEDRWNRTMLGYLVQGDFTSFMDSMDAYVSEAKVDMGFKHMHFLLGTMRDMPASAEVLGYGPLYGKAGAVVQFTPM